MLPLVNAKVDCIVIDSAHGHSKNIITTLKEIKAAYPDLQVIVGNVETGEATKALIEAGILDPAKVTRSALQNATSVASTLLTTESVVANIKEETPAAPAGAGMGGMM